MVKEGIVLGHKVSGAGLEVDKAKIDVISKLPPLLMLKELEVFWDMPDTRSSQEYLNDLEEEYQARVLLAKSKRFFKKGAKWFSSTKATDQTECHKCGKKCHFARDYWSKSSVPSYQSPFQPKPLSSSQHKPELRPTKDFEAKYNKVKAKLALLSSITLAFKALMVKNKCLITKSYEWDKEEVSSDENKMVEVKVLMALAEDNDVVSKEGARNGEWVKISMRKVHTLLEMEDNDDRKNYLEYFSGQKDLVFVKSLADDTKVSIPGVERPWLSEARCFIFPNHDIGRILPIELQRNITDPPITVTDFSATDYDSADESSVCSTPLSPLKKLDGVIINEPSSAPARGNKSTSTSKVNSALAGKLISVKIKDDPPLAIVMKELNDLKLQISKNQSSYSRNNHHQQGGSSSRSRTPRPSKNFFPRCIHYGFSDHLSDDYVNDPICDIYRSYDHDTHGYNRIISLRRGIKPRNPQHVMKSCETCGSTVHTTTDHNDIEWFGRGPKVVFGDDSTCITEGYGSIKCNGIVLTKVAFVNCLKYNLVSISQLCDAKYIVQFDEKRGTIFNSNKEVVMIALRVRDVYVLDMTSSTQETCFFAKASKNLNWLWHKILAHLNFKKINRLAKKILLLVFPHLSTQRTNHVHHVKRESIIGPTSKQNRHLGTARYQTNNNVVSFIEPYEFPKLVVLETKVSSDQNGHTDQNDQSVKDDEILNDDHSEHSNHTNDEQIINNLLNTEDSQISKPLSSPNTEDTSA
ncbi:retrovirus-related pol polyprotein from transposon TNT 1-94 [Tanacetum coccineum]|uniref:Retrovirus-related pol polyprotein from transposon TNT 1-94 n=1 Tax=Tanacetum coccineum TaxID=301880 RepID=A0ABQ5F0X3_9ASTR